jgi:hypothetical protein
MCTQIGRNPLQVDRAGETHAAAIPLLLSSFSLTVDVPTPVAAGDFWDFSSDFAGAATALNIHPSYILPHMGYTFSNPFQRYTKYFNCSEGSGQTWRLKQFALLDSSPSVRYNFPARIIPAAAKFKQEVSFHCASNEKMSYSQ